MSGRTELAAHLTDVLPSTWRVIDHDDSPTITRTTVMTWVQSIEHSTTLGHWRWSINVLVMIPKQTGGDNDLEDALEEVLEAIDLWDYPIDWRTAEYSVYAETYPAYKVTCEMHTKREYPEDNPTPEEE